VAIPANLVTGARHPVAPVNFTYVADGKEKTEVLRFTRRTISPHERNGNMEATIENLAPDKEELVRVLLYHDVQSPDILADDGAPQKLDADYLSLCDDSFLLDLWESVKDSRGPKSQTSATTR